MGHLKSYILQVVKRVIGNPVKVRHSEISLIHSADTNTDVDHALLEIALVAIAEAPGMDLSHISKRILTKVDYPAVWPGEHYKLLASLVYTLKPKVVVEIGTADGMGTLALQKHLPKNGQLHTFDIVPWNELEHPTLKRTDFLRNLKQHTENLTDFDACKKHEKLLQSADLIFIDAAKDGKMEYDIMENFAKIGLKEGALLVFDDIKVWNMLEFWETLEMPKLDVTSFGHWAGTGLVRWE